MHSLVIQKPFVFVLFVTCCFLVQVFAGVVEDKYSCPHGWTRYGNKKCLKYVNELQDYEKAQTTCRQKNQGTLVTIHSHDEQNFVYSYIHSIAASSTPIWLGAKQIDFESILWLDKTENSYVNWAPSEPSHPDEICIAINPRTGMWHDVMCTEANVPACERAPTTQWPFFVAFCSEGWFQFNDEKCVRIISSQALNFYESQELCRSKYNSKLLSIKTDKESEFLHNLIKFRDVKLPVWLGAVQNDFSSFNWIDKSDVTFTNWGEGEPNDPDHACISMQASSGGKWSDNDCKEQKLILCQKIVPEDGACETGWLQFRQDKCYRFVHVRLAFDDAETLCNNLYGGHLPSIHSQEEQFMISQFLASVNVKNGSEIWLGARQMDFHNFNWGDGSLFNYSYWEQGEPSFPAEKCIEMSWRNGRWNDINCRLKRAVLCERQVISRHHIKPNLYQSTTCLNLDSNCTSSSSASGAPSTAGAALPSSNELNGVGTVQIVNPSSEFASSTNATSSQQQPDSALTNKSDTVQLNNNGAHAQAQAPGSPSIVLPAEERSTIKVITSIMNRSHEHAKPTALTTEQMVPGVINISEAQSPASSNLSTPQFIHYNLPADRAFLPSPLSSPTHTGIDQDILQGKKAATLPEEMHNPESLLQQKNSPPAPFEQQVLPPKQADTAASNETSSLMEKIKPTTLSTGTNTTSMDAPLSLNSSVAFPPNSNSQQTAVAAQEFSPTQSGPVNNSMVALPLMSITL